MHCFYPDAHTTSTCTSRPLQQPRCAQMRSGTGVGGCGAAGQYAAAEGPDQAISSAERSPTALASALAAFVAARAVQEPPQMANSTLAVALGASGGLPAALISLQGGLVALGLALAALWWLGPSDSDWGRLPGPPPANWLLGHLQQVSRGPAIGVRGRLRADCMPPPLAAAPLPPPAPPPCTAAAARSRLLAHWLRLLQSILCTSPQQARAVVTRTSPPPATLTIVSRRAGQRAERPPLLPRRRQPVRRPRHVQASAPAHQGGHPVQPRAGPGKLLMPTACWVPGSGGIECQQATC